MRTLDFTNNRVELLTLDELKQTVHENYPNGHPVGDIYHFDLIERLLEILDRRNIGTEVTEIFAANNHDRYRPGVTISREVAERDGEGALSAHILRRVYANIHLKSLTLSDEEIPNLAIAYTQRGIQIGVGPLVRVCHNQCILSATDVFSNFSCYGRYKTPVAKTVEEMVMNFEKWSCALADRLSQWENDIQVMKATACDEERLQKFLGALLCWYVQVESSDPKIHRNDVYPLNQTQIGHAADIAVRELLTHQGHEPFTMWNLYNCTNIMLKPGLASMPTILPQSVALHDAIHASLYNHSYED